MKGLVAAEKILLHIVFSWKKFGVFKDFREFPVSCVAGDFIREIFHEVVGVPFLYDFWRMENDAMTKLP